MYIGDANKDAHCAVRTIIEDHIGDAHPGLILETN